MPEGDTIHRLASNLGPALTGASVRRLHVHRTPPTRIPSDVSIDVVWAVGKHLLVRFDTGHLLDSHLLMNGSWDLYRRGDRWRKSRGAMRAVIETDAVEAVLFSTPKVRLLHPRDPAPRPWDQLGPDLCLPDVDLDAATERARWLPADTEIAEVLLDQRPACGIGNVYKSETLWAERLHPTTPLGDVEDELLRRLYETASRLLRHNLDRSRRVTFRDGLAVYGRDRRVCPRCATPIRVTKQGGLDRVTYWCPTCQER
ncbi:MAG: DNA-formamidopyrimidine glycosylase family protein [Actinomycetota bacterium]